MQDNEKFITEFEACTLSAQEFHHQDHIKLAWLYLQRFSLSETLARFSEGLKRFAATLGKTNLYHETITWAYVLLIRERIERIGRKQSWNEFRESNPDLFDWKNSILKTYYSDETLQSEFARRVFVFPDRPSQATER